MKSNKNNYLKNLELSNEKEIKLIITEVFYS
jgi:hypothetical protein